MTGDETGPYSGRILCVSNNRFQEIKKTDLIVGVSKSLVAGIQNVARSRPNKGPKHIFSALTKRRFWNSIATCYIA